MRLIRTTSSQAETGYSAMGARAKEAGVIHEHIKLAESFQHRLYDRFRLRRVAHVANATMRSLPVAQFQPPPDSMSASPRVNKHAGALTPIRHGNRLADATAATGDEHDFPT